MLQLVIIAVYFLVMVIIGVVSRKQAKGADDFFVAGRKGSTLLIAGSLLATIVGGSATVGMAGLGFSRGLSGAWWLLVGSIGLVVLGVFLAKKVRAFGLYTLPELITKQYDRRVGLAASVLIVVAWVGVIAAQIIASGTILGTLGIGTPTLWMVIFSAVFITYSVLGGQQAIIRTDAVQTGIIIAGVFGGLALVMSRLGGWSGLAGALPAGHFSFPVSPGFSGYDLVSLLLLVGLTYVVGPDMYSRLFCARDTKTARKSVLWAALIIVPVAFGITLIGMGASALFPQIPAEQALPVIISEVLPPFLGGVVLAALLGALMSSADTCLLSASTILTVDIVGAFKPLGPAKTLSYSRWAMVIMGAAALSLALALNGVISALLFAYTIYTGGLIMPVLVGFYREKFRVTPRGALAAIIGGGSAALVSKILAIKYLDLGSLAISLGLLFLVSFFDNRVGASQLDGTKDI
ncbi:MAG: sodium:solute symporter family protein [Dehalococcoidales bacterium]|nr:sodium:solute symporter family protein [Dehalococcoidales bacterium]